MTIGFLATGPTAQAVVDPVATQINVTAVDTPGIVVPNTAGAPASFIVANTPFDVHLTFTTADLVQWPISRNKDARISLTALSGPETGKVVGTGTVPKGSTQATISGTLTKTANDVRLSVTATIGNKPVADLKAGETKPLDVQKAFVSAPATSTLTSIGTGGGVGVPCTATPSQPVCADLLLPNPAGIKSNVLLSLGACDSFLGCPANSSVVQALVDLDDTVYTRNNPMTLVFKCDKTQCPGGAIRSYELKVELTHDSAPTTAPPCDAKGVIQPGADFCLDYVQSTRDNAGDTILYLLLLTDVRTQGP